MISFILRQPKIKPLLTYASRELNTKQKIIIMEDMTGRNANLTDGGIFHVCRKTKMKNNLEEVLKQLEDFNPCCEPNNEEKTDFQERYNTCLFTIKKALKKAKWRI